jgi:hypothetical protein
MEAVKQYSYDFNSPPNEAGFYQVVISEDEDHTVRRGDVVEIGEEELRRRFRVRTLMIVVEPIEGEDWIYPEEGV